MVSGLILVSEKADDDEYYSSEDDSNDRTISLGTDFKNIASSVNESFRMSNKR